MPKHMVRDADTLLAVGDCFSGFVVKYFAVIGSRRPSAAKELAFVERRGGDVATKCVGVGWRAADGGNICVELTRVSVALRSPVLDGAKQLGTVHGAKVCAAREQYE